MMERTKPLTRFSTAIFFQNYAMINEIYCPWDILQAAVDEVLHRGPEPFARAVQARLEELIGALKLPTAADCLTSARSRRTKGVVVCTQLGDNGFACVDDLLLTLARVYQTLRNQRNEELSALFAKYDTDGDGNFSADEFAAMLERLRPELAREKLMQLYTSAFQAMPLTVEQLDLVLFSFEEREHLDDNNLAAQVAESVEAEMVSLSQFYPARGRQYPAERFDSFLDNWRLITQIQARFRGALVRKGQVRICEAQRHPSLAPDNGQTIVHA